MLRLADNKLYIVSLKPHDNYISGSVSTGRNAAKKDETPEWKNSFWMVSFVGKECVEKAKKLGAKDRILVRGNKCQQTAEPYTDKNTGEMIYPKPTLIIFDFEYADASTSKAKPEAKKKPEPTPFNFD